MVFGFGKALDVLGAGDPVRRHEWAPDVAILLVPRQVIEPPPQLRAVGVDFIVEDERLMILCKYEEEYVRKDWTPRAIDLLAGDWEYVTP